jgi:small subunit ribosomal protein S1
MPPSYGPRNTIVRRKRDDDPKSAAPEQSTARPDPLDAPAPVAVVHRATERSSERRASPAAVAPAPAAPTATMDGDALLEELAALGADPMADLLAGSGPREPQAGDRVQGVVARVGQGVAFVSIGAKAEAILEAGPEGLPALGETITATVVATGVGGIRLATGVGRNSGPDALIEAHEAGLPVEGRVVERNTGGFIIRVGAVRAFCPVSQIDLLPSPDLDTYLEQNFLFKVADVRGRDVVLSRRALMEVEAAAGADALWAAIEAGDRRDGVVAGVRDFGVFVDLGGVQGLVHKSELGWDSDAPMPERGQRVSVVVVSVDRGAHRISLSMKDQHAGPWSRVGSDFEVGGVYPARIVRLTEYGAFARLAPGLDGLIHISAMSDRRIGHPSEVVSVDQDVQVRLLSADASRQRLELSMKVDADAAEAFVPRGESKQVGTLGTLADLFAGMKIRK